MTKRDYYEILGINKDATKEDIKKAYKKLALKHHPDKGGDAEKFKELSEAYAVLSDNEKRQQYDQFGHQGFDQRFSQEDIFRNFDFSDIFSEIFGNSFDETESILDMLFFGRSPRRQQHGSDLHYELEISLKEAVFGTEKTINIQRTEVCPDCNGSGAKDNSFITCSMCNGTGQINSTRRTPFGIFTQITTCKECGGEGKTIRNPCPNCNHGLIKKNKKLSVKIPAGIDTENQIRIANGGNSNRGGSGNLYLTIYVKPDKTFERQEYDLLTTVPISFPKATLGSEIEIPTLEKPLKLKIPAGTQSHTIFRLRNHGIPRLHHYGRGDLLVKVVIDTPKNLTKKQKVLLEEFAKESSEKIKSKRKFF